MLFSLLAEETVSGENTSTIWTNILEWAITSGIRLVIAILLLLVSFKLINFIGKRYMIHGEKKNWDKTLTKTCVYVGKVVLKIVVVTCLIGFVGIETSGISALIASVGVCVGLAVNGALSNFAGGVMIILTRPFRIDDFIEACGYIGTVEDIHIIHTKIRTPDNKVVYLPNGSLSSASVINYSEKETRRVDFAFSVAYSADFAKARNLILDIFRAHELVLQDPEPMIKMSEHASSSINITARCWVKNENYWTVHFDVIEAVKKSFDENGIEIPFNQLDVHVK